MGLVGKSFCTALRQTLAPFSPFGTEQILTEQSLPIALFLTRLHIAEVFFCGSSTAFHGWLETQAGSDKSFFYSLYQI